MLWYYLTLTEDSKKLVDNSDLNLAELERVIEFDDLSLADKFDYDNAVNSSGRKVG